jgi:hypothetical protein
MAEMPLLNLGRIIITSVMAEMPLLNSRHITITSVMTEMPLLNSGKLSYGGISKYMYVRGNATIIHESVYFRISFLIFKLGISAWHSIKNIKHWRI